MSMQTTSVLSVLVVLIVVSSWRKIPSVRALSLTGQIRGGTSRSSRSLLSSSKSGTLESFSVDAFGDGALSDETFRELYTAGGGGVESKKKAVLPTWLIDRCEECGWTNPTLIQERGLDAILTGQDVILHAQTGSGKTLAYLLPLLGQIDPTRSSVQAVIVVPTRELGVQVSRVARRLASAYGASLRDSTIESAGDEEKYNFDEDEDDEKDGGEDMNHEDSSDENENQMKRSARGSRILVMSLLQGSANKRQRAWAWAEPPHVVVGTPAELTSMVKYGGIRYNAVRFVVVDEVDACLLNNGGGGRPSSAASAASPVLPSNGPLHDLLSRYLSPTFDDGLAASLGDEDSFLTASASDIAAISSSTRVVCEDRQTIFASATIPQHNHFLKQCLQRRWIVQRDRPPIHVQVSPGELVPPTLKHAYIVCASTEDRLTGVRRFLQKEAKLGRLRRALVFCDSRRSMEEMAKLIASDFGDSGIVWKGGANYEEASQEEEEAKRFRVANGSVVEGDLRAIVSVLRVEDSATVRAAAMNAFRGPRWASVGNGENVNDGNTTERSDDPKDRVVRIMLATDLASRGLDVPDISHVINFDLANDGDTYVHRGGRAGRWGKKGIVLSVVTAEQEFVLERLGNKLRLDIRCILRQQSKKRKRITT